MAIVASAGNNFCESVRHMFRSFHVNDIPQVYAIERLTQAAPWTEEIFRHCLHAGYIGWVLELDKQLIAFILVNLQGDECHILNIAVRPEFQRQGRGRKLLEYALLNMQQQGANMAYLEVRRSNTRAIALYEQLGFSLI